MNEKRWINFHARITATIFCSGDRDEVFKQHLTRGINVAEIAKPDELIDEVAAATSSSLSSPVPSDYRAKIMSVTKELFGHMEDTEIERLNHLWECEHETVMRLLRERAAIDAQPTKGYLVYWVERGVSTFVVRHEDITRGRPSIELIERPQKTKDQEHGGDSGVGSASDGPPAR